VRERGRRRARGGGPARLSGTRFVLRAARPI
jgi:hypothetical protein